VPGSSHQVAILLGWGIRAAPKHQVLEEVREARLAGFDLVAGPGLDGDVDTDQIGEPGWDDNDFQPVWQRPLGRAKGKYVSGRSRLETLLS
jgi:hypothetical protein